jgi:ribosomal protein S18 acetylase RimI-like enzyme
VDLVADIEDAFVAQWSHFGRWPKGELHERDGVVWIETPIRRLPYNAVVRTHLTPDGADATLDRLLDRYRQRGVEFMWLVHPSATPTDLGERLAVRGLDLVEQATGMSLELSEWEGAAPAGRIEEVRDQAGLDTYADLIMHYWEIPPREQALVREINNFWSGGRTRGHRYLAFSDDGAPVGKGYLSLEGPEGVAAIFGMSVVPEARGRGIATSITRAMLNRAKEAGCARAVLHSSEAAVPLYRRTGFTPRCSLQAYATGSLWSEGH